MRTFHHINNLVWLIIYSYNPQDKQNKILSWNGLESLWFGGGKNAFRVWVLFAWSVALIQKAVPRFIMQHTKTYVGVHWEMFGTRWWKIECYCLSLCGEDALIPSLPQRRYNKLMLSLSCPLGYCGASEHLRWIKTQIQVLLIPRHICCFFQGSLALI